MFRNESLRGFEKRHKACAGEHFAVFRVLQVFFAPMACLLFIGFRMRVLQLTQGQGNPQGWARMCMEAVSYAILANTLIALIIPVFTETEVEIDHETGEVKTDSANPFSNQIMAVLFTVLRYLTFLGLYVGFGGVLVGIYLFEPPKELFTEFRVLVDSGALVVRRRDGRAEHGQRVGLRENVLWTPGRRQPTLGNRELPLVLLLLLEHR